ncbi:thioredoxin-disulfide reductase [Anaeromassilibacillus senegalensis]|uniref:thioredoxin-disulfide reductase n=1 Tax=Anaeromassilibacillus senegalensis TaxID=1673717 RepID=UPI000680B75B|nr:thioredoxin-disulfide reductase [Anaeromassilibacillus senegalensis]
MNQYDVIVVGGGPAGYTAALYCARAALSTLIIEAMAPGGQMGTTDQIDNYPGFADGVNGFELAMEMQKQAERFGAVSVFAQVSSLHLDAPVKKICTEDGEKYESSAVILALGASPRELGLPNEKNLRGKGVSYCATCDGMFYKGKTVAVIGGGDTAAADTVFLSKICEKIYLVHRRDTLRASKAYLKPLEKCENVEFVWDSVVEKILENGKVTGIRVKNVKTEEQKELTCDGVFIAVGNIPNTGLVKESLRLTPAGYIDAGESTETNLPGVFAAGDVRQKVLRQVVTAVSDGAVAAHMTEEYLTKK